MVMSPSAGSRTAAPGAAVIWHDLECGAYRADLGLWLSLAADAATEGRAARVLDIGAGTGRVAIVLGRAGHLLSALDIDPLLVAALRERAAGLPVTATVADARTFALERRGHDLGLVPMQTLQLLRGAAERAALFERACEHLRPGALLACAIVTDVESFDSRDGRLGPTPEHVRLGGDRYLSRAIRVQAGHRVITIERERLVERAPGSAGVPPASELDVIELERLTADQLQREAEALGLTAEPTLAIAETEDHSASEVVVFRV